jgi:hypothetical protein
MSSTLLENLNSDFLNAFSALLPKSAAQRVLVYVESDDDIAFWRNVLNLKIISRFVEPIFALQGATGL